jgi:hypothetical protein
MCIRLQAPKNHELHESSTTGSTAETAGKPSDDPDIQVLPHSSSKKPSIA